MPIVRNTGILNLDQMPRFETNLNRVSWIETYADVFANLRNISQSYLFPKISIKKRKKDRGSIEAADYEIIKERNLFLVYIKDILWINLQSRGGE